MRRQHPASLPRAKALRQSLTEAERLLWGRLRRRQIGGHRFRRQVPIGPFVVDFACLAQRLIVELDGGQHARQGDADRRRDEWLARRGYRVVRFWNTGILENIDGVVSDIGRRLGEAP